MKKNQDIIALIPARARSKGIKNKNIKKFCGKPIIDLTHCILSSSRRDVVSNTSNKKDRS